MGELVIPPVSQIAVFMAAVLVVTSFVITVAGQFPVEHRNQTLTRGGGAALLWGSIALTALVGVGALVYAWLFLPWYVAVIAGGFMILVAPYVLHPLPNEVINGRGVLLVLALLALAVAGLMWLTAA